MKKEANTAAHIIHLTGPKEFADTNSSLIYHSLMENMSNTKVNTISVGHGFHISLITILSYNILLICNVYIIKKFNITQYITKLYNAYENIRK
jgi:hypothetical protein